MILIDTSAWVEFLRGTDSPTCVAVDGLLGSDIAVCDPVSMEVLAADGTAAETHADVFMSVAFDLVEGTDTPKLKRTKPWMMLLKPLRMPEVNQKLVKPKMKLKTRKIYMMK